MAQCKSCGSGAAKKKTNTSFNRQRGVQLSNTPKPRRKSTVVRGTSFKRK